MRKWWDWFVSGWIADDPDPQPSQLDRWDWGLEPPPRSKRDSVQVLADFLTTAPIDKVETERARKQPKRAVQESN